MLTGMPLTPVKGLAGSQEFMPRFCAFTWMGLRPDWMALRVGEQNLKTSAPREASATGRRQM